MLVPEVIIASILNMCPIWEHFFNDPPFFYFQFLVTFYFSFVSLLHESLFPVLSHNLGGKHSVRRRSISLFFPRESSRHLVSNAIFFTRETSNFPVLFFFRPSRRNCRGSRVTAINFPPARSAAINRATARTSFSTARTSPILQAKLNLYYNEILSSPGKTGKLVSLELARKIYIRDVPPMSLVSSRI